MRVAILVASSVAACWLMDAAMAATRPASATTKTTTTETGEMIQLDFPPNMEIRVLIEYVSKRLNLNILYDEADGKKRVTVSSPARIPKDSLLGLFQSILKMSDLALIDADQPGWKRIVPNKDLLSITAGVASQPSGVTIAESADVITQIFELRNAGASFVEGLIKPFLSKPGGNSFTIPDRNLIVVTDYAGRLRRIVPFIELLDKPGEKATMRFVPVRNLHAADLARQVSSLLSEKDRLSPGEGKAAQHKLALAPEPRTNQIVLIGDDDLAAEALDLIKALDVPVNAETRSYRLRHVAPQRIDKLARDLVGASELKDLYKSSVDAESGMLMVTAPEELHKKIASLCQELDVADADPERSHVQFYKLLNTTASNVLSTIRAMDSGDQSLVKLMVEPGAPQSDNFNGPNNPPGQVGAEPPKPPFYRPTSGPASQPSEEAAPAATPSITAKTKDATITADINTNTLIVVAPPAAQRIYKQLIHQLDKRRPQVMIEVTLVTLDNSNSLSLGVDLSRAGLTTDPQYVVFSSFDLSKVNSTTGSLAITPGTGFNGTLIGPDSINAVIRALSTCGNSRILSAPRVLVNDNSSASLSSVSEAPFTSVNASQTVATTTFAGYASAGTTVTVTPHISEGDHLQLQYTITLNSFSGKGSGGVPPPRQTNQVNSEVTVPDGYTVIVGGLNRKDSSKTASKVPLLGDVPILGHLFSSDSINDSESTLFVFIRPIILRDDKFEDMKYFAERDLAIAGRPSNYPSSNPIVMN